MVQQDLELLRDIPGYKAILKALIKSQIQYLVEQLSAHGDEESVLLTASISDGSLSHLGSDSGRVFLDKHEDIKSQFLGFCLKRQHSKSELPAELAHASSRSDDTYQLLSQQSVPMKHRRSLAKQHFSSAVAPYPNRVRPSGPKSSSKPETSHAPVLSSSFTADISETNYTRETNLSANSQNESEVGKREQGEEVGVKSNDNINTDGVNSGETNMSITGEPSAMETGRDSAQRDNGDVENPDVSNIKVEAVACDDDILITGVEGGVAQPTSQMEDSTSWMPYSQQHQQPGNDSFDIRTIPPSEGFPADFLQALQVTQPPGDDYNVVVSDGLRMFACPICNKMFCSRLDVKKHVRKHTGEKPYQCPVCACSFSQSSSCYRHVRQRHPDHTISNPVQPRM